MLIRHRNCLPGVNKLFCPAILDSLSCSQEESKVSSKALSIAILWAAARVVDMQGQRLLWAFILCLSTVRSQDLFQTGGQNWPDMMELSRCNGQDLYSHMNTHTHTFAEFELYHTWRETSTLWCNSSQPKMHPKNYSPKNACFPSFLHQRIRISPGWRHHKVRVFGKGGSLEKWPREEYWFCSVLLGEEG